MSRAAELCSTAYLCFVDADIESSSVNIPLALREALAAERADMVVVRSEEPARRTRSTTTAIYRPLLEAFFPEALDRGGATPLSGFRLVRAEPRLGRLPAGFGAEVHLNVGFAVAGRPIEVADVGVYHGPVRPSGDIASDAADAILDLAEEHGRLHPDDRDRWDAWAAGVTAVIRDRPERGPLEDFQTRLSDAASRRPERA